MPVIVNVRLTLDTDSDSRDDQNNGNDYDNDDDDDCRWEFDGLPLQRASLSLVFKSTARDVKLKDVMTFVDVGSLANAVSSSKL